MRNSSDAGAAFVVIGAILLLLLLAAGGGFFYLARSQQVAFVEQAERAKVEADRAKMAEIQAKRQVEQALVQARESAKSRTPLQDSLEQHAPDDSVSSAVEILLRAQEKAWNEGDLEGFMDHSWKSEALTFAPAVTRLADGSPRRTAIRRDIRPGKRWTA